MGRYLQQTEGRSALQQKIAADLRAKAAARAKDEGGQGDTFVDAPDGIDDSQYIKGTKKTTSLAGLWLIVFFMAVAVFIFFIIQASR